MTLYIVVTGSALPASAACSVCQASVAHLMRLGNSRTPAKTPSLPSSASARRMQSAPQPPLETRCRLPAPEAPWQRLGIPTSARWFVAGAGQHDPRDCSSFRPCVEDVDHDGFVVLA